MSFRRILTRGGLVASLLFSGCTKPTSSQDNEEAPPPENHAPVIHRVLKSSDSINGGEHVTFTCEASDQDGDALTYVWGYSFGSSEQLRNQLNWESPNRDRNDQIHYFDVTVKDNHGASDDERVSIPVRTKFREFFPIRDAMVSSSCPDDNMYNSCSLDFFTPYFLSISSSNQVSPEERSYLTFNLTSINYQQIDEAKLILIAIDGGGQVPGTLESELGFVNSVWSNTGITWNNQPSFESRNNYFSVPLSNGSYQIIGLEDYVTSWVMNPVTNYGIVLMPRSYENGVRKSRVFASSRANEHFNLGETDPKLEVWLK